MIKGVREIRRRAMTSPVRNLPNNLLQTEAKKINFAPFKINKISNGVKKVLDFILDFIWPEFCLGCHREGSLCCEQCQKNLTLLPLKSQNWPDLPHPYFESCFICIDYENPLVEKLIKKYKYDFIEKISDILVNILAQQATKLTLNQGDIITNIPLHKHRLRERGFDQTAILADKLAKKMSLAYIPLLQRIKRTKSQAKLHKTQRQDNVSGAFQILPAAYDLPNNNIIILIDDVATTGATLNEAARALKTAGYEKIICLVIAKNNP